MHEYPLDWSTQQAAVSHRAGLGCLVGTRDKTLLLSDDTAVATTALCCCCCCCCCIPTERNEVVHGRSFRASVGIKTCLSRSKTIGLASQISTKVNLSHMQRQQQCAGPQIVPRRVIGSVRL